MSNKSSGAGISISALSFITFVVFLMLKLTGTIAWSWWWVTAPLWAPPLALVAFIITVLLMVAIVLGVTLVLTIIFE